MRNHLISIVLILLAGIFSYSNSLRGEFVFDDITGIVQKTAIHDLKNVTAIWDANHSRFGANLSFAVNYHLGGLNVLGYHIVNIAIHLINGILVYWFVYLLSSRAKRGDPVVSIVVQRDWLLPLFVALLFVSHPIQTQSVAYISQRTTSLSALWYLMSMILWIVFVRAKAGYDALPRRWGVLMAAYFFAVFAFLTKEYTYTLPLAAGLLLFFIQKKRIPPSLRVAAGGFFLIALVMFLIARTTVLNHPVSGIQEAISLPTYSARDSSRWEFMVSEVPVVVTYIRLLIFPVNQNVDHDVAVYRSPTEPVIIGSLVLLVLLAVAAIRLRKKYPLISLGMLFFFVTLAAESSVIPITDLMMEHRLYLPSVGFFLVAVGGIAQLFQKLSVRPVVYCAFMISLIAVCMMMTYRRNGVWQNGVELWHDVVSKSPNKARGHFNFGGALISHGYRSEGLEELVVAQHLDPSYKEAVIAVFTLLQKGQSP